MIYSYGCRIDNDSNAITVINEENSTADTKGYINGEYIEFGSGSSDFSTATVTLVDSGGVSAALYGAFYYESLPPVFNDPNTNAVCYTDQETAEIILYKGVAIIDASAVQDAGASFTVSGNATAPPLMPMITVTGDCTITIS